MSRPRRRSVGVRRKRQGWQAYVRIRGRLLSKQFPANTPLETMQAWRHQQAGAHLPSPHGTFAADAEAYLKRKTAMPTYAQRVTHLAWWVERLGGTRITSTLSAQEISEALQELLVAGYAPTTVLHYHTALSNFWTTTFGKAAHSPLREVPRPKALEQPIRAVSYDVIRQVLVAVDAPDSRARLSLIAYTGLPPATIGRLRRDDYDAPTATLRVPGRRKGGGTRPWTLPLSAEAVEALELLDTCRGWGPFNPGRLHRHCVQAAEAVGVKLYPYMLRHSFGTALYRATGDLGATGRLMGHAPGSPLTARYVGAAMADVDRKAVEAARAIWAGGSCPEKRPPAESGNNDGPPREPGEA